MQLEQLPFLEENENHLRIRKIFLVNTHEVLIFLSESNRDNVQIRMYRFTNCLRKWIIVFKISHDTNDSLLQVPNVAQLDSKQFLYYGLGYHSIWVYSLENGSLNYRIPIGNQKMVDKVVVLKEFMVIIYAGSEDHWTFDIFSLKERRIILENILTDVFQVESQPVIHAQVPWRDIYFITNTKSILVNGLDNLNTSLWKICVSDKKKECVELDRVERFPDRENNFNLMDKTNLCIHDDFLFSFTPRRIDVYKLIDEHIIWYRQLDDDIHNPMVNFQRIYPEHDCLLIKIKNFNQTLEFNLEDTEEVKNRTLIQIRNFHSKKSEILYEFDELAEGIKINSVEAPFIVYLRYPAAPATFLMVSKCNKIFKLTLDDMVIGHAFSEIRKNARLVCQAFRTNTSMFSRLPVEILLRIILETRNIPNEDEVQKIINKSNEDRIKKMMIKYFCRPLEDSI